MKSKILLIFVIFIVGQTLKAQRTYYINETKTFQTIHGFGAADAWSNEYIKLWNDSVKNLAADWLFSKETNKDGSYKGIGLSLWRYNIGAGSTEQGDSSGIGDPFRRTEAIINANGTFNENRQIGTQSFVKEAKERGLEKLVMFSNSPPVFLTRNGKAFSGICNETNLSIEKYDAFADYLTRSLLYFKENGIDFDYISPVNEPEWKWCQQDGQEGCPYKNIETCGIVKSLDKKLTESNLETSIQIPESGLLLFANSGYRFKPGRQREIKSFFNNKKDTYVGNQPHLAKQIVGHSYFTEWPIWTMRKVRKKIARTSEHYGLEYWMSEYCILQKTKEITGNGRDLGMHTALYVSRVIHHDLVYGNASSWSWWLGVSTADYKDGLVYANREGTSIVDSKLMWAMGNFSQFIKPGAIRVDIEGKRDSQFFVSAYRNPGAKNLVIVIINMKPVNEKILIKGLQKGLLSAWETSPKKNLQYTGQLNSIDELDISGQSITTFVLQD